MSQELPPGARKDPGGEPFHALAGMEQKTGAALIRILLLEDLHVLQVIYPRPFRSLDLDRQQFPSSLNHEVNLLADRSSPIENVGALQTRVPPGQQIPQNQIFEIGPVGFVQTG